MLTQFETSTSPNMWAKAEEYKRVYEHGNNITENSVRSQHKPGGYKKAASFAAKAGTIRTRGREESRRVPRGLSSPRYHQTRFEFPGP